MKSPSRTLVTGGTGFLGRHLVERLISQGRSIAIFARTPAPDLERKGVTFIQGSLTDPNAVQAACAGVGTVFHIAARVGVWGRYNEFHAVNVLGTRALLDGCRRHGVSRLIHTSSPSVVYNGLPLAAADESLPLTKHCPSPYPLTKAIAEREVLEASAGSLRTVALRPHLIWGVGDPHLIPRLLARARSGRLRVVGRGDNRVDMVHVENAVDAHLAAEAALDFNPAAVSGRAYFITNDEPVALWQWINALLGALGIPRVERRVSLPAARAFGLGCEIAWHLLPLRGEPPMTRFIADELARDHWFSIAAAKRDLGYSPRVSMESGTRELIASLRGRWQSP
ncbi:MAG: NAD-dependent epimerase/dehydratase family protein [Opitutaceae bacterium]|nr:NAD-dependent epimerase/dehydratase family protein [Opitutaceae bacterium]